MKWIYQLFAALATLAGFWFLLQTVITPYSFRAESAIQQTTVYGIGTYNATAATAFFVLAIFMNNLRRSGE